MSSSQQRRERLIEVRLKGSVVVWFPLSPRHPSLSFRFQDKIIFINFSSKLGSFCSLIYIFLLNKSCMYILQCLFGEIALKFCSFSRF